MKKITHSLLTVTLFLSTLLFPFSLFSQDLHPVSWTTEVKKVEGNIAEIHIKAKIQDGWNLYDLNVPPGGPLPTVFTFAKSGNFQLSGKIIATPKPTVTYDDVFKLNIGKWKKNVTFIQKIKVLQAKKFDIVTDIEFMMCDENSCIPLADNLKISVDGTLFEAETVTPEVESHDSVTAEVQDTVNSKVITSVENIVPDNQTENRSIWYIFWLGLLGGFLALLTPDDSQFLPEQNPEKRESC